MAAFPPRFSDPDALPAPALSEFAPGRAYALTPVEGVPGMSLALDAVTEAEEAELIARLEAGEWSAQLARATQQFGACYVYATRRLADAPPVPDWLAGLAPFVGCAHCARSVRGLRPRTERAQWAQPT